MKLLLVYLAISALVSRWAWRRRVDHARQRDVIGTMLPPPRDRPIAVAGPGWLR